MENEAKTTTCCFRRSTKISNISYFFPDDILDNKSWIHFLSIEMAYLLAFS